MRRRGRVIGTRVTLCPGRFRQRSAWWQSAWGRPRLGQENRDHTGLPEGHLYVVAEILDSENVDHARTAGADEVIETRRIGYSMIAHAVGYHGTATAMSRVLISGSHNVYIGTIPGDRKDPVAFGELLVEMALSKRGGLVVGIRTPSGEEVINPEKELFLEPDTHLLYLAEKPLLDPPH